MSNESSASNGSDKGTASSSTPSVTHVKTTRPAPPPRAAKTVKGQRHVAPANRHSQQTHRRARERAAAEGHTTEREQHDSDREVVQAALTSQADQQKQQKREQAERTGSRPAKSDEASGDSSAD